MSDAIIAAIIGGTSGAVIGFVSAYFTTRSKIKQEAKIWNSDFAISYSKLLVEDSAAARQLALQFTVGIIIVRSEKGATISKHFIPYQCRVAVGRALDNDIVLADKFVSRDHGVFFYRGNRIIYHEFAPLNETLVNGKPIKQMKKLKSGDRLKIGNSHLEFQELR